MMEMAGIHRELRTLSLGRVTGMEGLLQLGGRDGLAHRDIQFPVQQPFMGFLDVDGLPDSKHGSDPITI